VIDLGEAVFKEFNGGGVCFEVGEVDGAGVTRELRAKVDGGEGHFLPASGVGEKVGEEDGGVDVSVELGVFFFERGEGGGVAKEHSPSATGEEVEHPAKGGEGGVGPLPFDVPGEGEGWVGEEEVKFGFGFDEEGDDLGAVATHEVMGRWGTEGVEFDGEGAGGGVGEKAGEEAALPCAEQVGDVGFWEVGETEVGGEGFGEVGWGEELLDAFGDGVGGGIDGFLEGFGGELEAAHGSVGLLVKSQFVVTNVFHMEQGHEKARW
jgi:hypothetical protein